MTEPNETDPGRPLQRGPGLPPDSARPPARFEVFAIAARAPEDDG